MTPTEEQTVGPLPRATTVTGTRTLPKAESFPEWGTSMKPCCFPGAAKSTLVETRGDPSRVFDDCLAMVGIDIATMVTPRQSVSLEWV